MAIMRQARSIRDNYRHSKDVGIRVTIGVWVVLALLFWFLQRVIPTWLLVVLAVAAFVIVVASSISYANSIRFWFPCTHCGRGVCGEDDWICGFCSHEHRRDKESVFKTFLEACSECKHEPQGYVCPHCGKVISLEDLASDKPKTMHRLITQDIARRIEVLLPGETVEQMRTRQQRQLLELEMEKERLKKLRELREEEMALHGTERKFDAIKTPPQSPAPKSRAEKMVDNILKEHLDPIKAWKLLQESPELKDLDKDEREAILKEVEEKLLNRKEFRPYEVD